MNEMPVSINRPLPSDSVSYFKAGEEKNLFRFYNIISPKSGENHVDGDLLIMMMGVAVVGDGGSSIDGS